jgi:hypothetical protein
MASRAGDPFGRSGAVATETLLVRRSVMFHSPEAGREDRGR